MSLVEIERRNGASWLFLNRPERHNALIQLLLDELNAAIATEKDRMPAALILSARGRSFSTGGDIGGFLEHSQNEKQLLSYAERLVGALHDALLALLSFPAPVLAAINGPVTGGSTGFLLAADMVAMADTAFVQPYYCEVGFGPDGGWTALLPEKVGTGKALELQYLNTRVSAADAHRLGLAASVCPASQLDRQIDVWVTDIDRRFQQTHRVTRQNVWDTTRRQLVQVRLDQEKARFLELITRPETLAGMKEFIRQSA